MERWRQFLTTAMWILCVMTILYTFLRTGAGLIWGCPMGMTTILSAHIRRESFTQIKTQFGWPATTVKQATTENLSAFLLIGQNTNPSLITKKVIPWNYTNNPVMLYQNPYCCRYYTEQQGYSIIQKNIKLERRNLQWAKEKNLITDSYFNFTVFSKRLGCIQLFL